MLTAAFIFLALIEAFCVAGLVMQAKEYGREQRIERAARIRQLERELGIGA